MPIAIQIAYSSAESSIFELRFEREEGCPSSPISFQLHGLDEVLQHPISSLAACELVCHYLKFS